ncbi:MAG: DUF560 domain-containing protein [Porphyrobacter sp.]|nr:DUF560 domain-containing protein [Porphyrobacter sp.]
MGTPCVAQDSSDDSIKLSAVELFDFADRTRDAGDFATAETAYLALAQDPDLELRTEARFRLALMYADKMDRKRDAAVLLRRILDDKPDAAPVRLKLAQVLAELGEYQSARRELRAVQAGGLPPDVAQLVRFYSNALSATKRLGGSLDIAIAPSTNINRATRSDTLGTVIGDFTLSEDAQAQSGVGLALKAQGYGRVPLNAKTDLLVRLNAAGDLYRRSEFDDVTLSVQAGPQFISGRDRLALSLTAGHRWYGLDPYSVFYGVSGNWDHPLDDKTQIRIDASALKDDNSVNRLQDADRFTAAVGLDRAFSSTTGGGVRVFGSRDDARDPGYSNTSGGGSVYLYQDVARTTMVVNAAYRRLESDARLFLYPERRKDDNLDLSLSATFRSLTIGTFAPLTRVRYERNWSTVGIYDYDRLAFEFGVVSAF